MKNTKIRHFFTLVMGMAFFASKAELNDITFSVEHFLPEITYKKAIDVGLSIWTDIEPLHTGTFNHNQNVADFFDLNIGRLVYLQKCIMLLKKDKKHGYFAENMNYLKEILSYIMQESNQFLFYETDRAFCFESLLKETIEAVISLDVENPSTH